MSTNESLNVKPLPPVEPSHLPQHQSDLHSVKRKPVPVSNIPSNLASKEYVSHYEEGATRVPHSRRHARRHRAHHSRPAWTISGVRKRFSAMSRRRRMIIIALAVLCFVLLILVIVLPATLVHKHQNLPLPSSHGGPYTGDLTYYDPGLGACGITSSSSENVVAVSHYIFDKVSTGSNPNSNPLCGLKIRAKYTIGDQSRTVDLTVVDRCVGCQPTDIDVTISVFKELTGNVDLGRVKAQWNWLQDVPT